MVNVNSLDWQKVGFPTNPVQGDPAGVRSLAATYKRVGDSFATMGSTLMRLGTPDGLQGAWVATLKKKTTELPKDFTDLGTSLHTASAEVSTWAGELEDLQQRAVNAYNSVCSAQAAKSSADDQLVKQGLKYSLCCAGAAEVSRSGDQQATAEANKEVEAAKEVLAQYNHQVDTASSNLADARKTLQAICTEYSQKGDAHAGKIRSAKAASPQFKNGWEAVYYSDTWKCVVKIAEITAGVVGIAGLLCGGWVIAAATIASAAVLAANAAMKAANNDGSRVDAVIEIGFSILTCLPEIELFAGMGKMALAGKSLREMKGFEAIKPTGLLKSLKSFVKARGEKAAAAGAEHVSGAAETAYNCSKSNIIDNAILKYLNGNTPYQMVKSSIRVARQMKKASRGGNVLSVVKTGVRFAHREKFATKTLVQVGKAKGFVLDSRHTGKPTFTQETVLNYLVPLHSSFDSIHEGLTA